MKLILLNKPLIITLTGRVAGTKAITKVSWNLLGLTHFLFQINIALIMVFETALYCYL